MSNAGRIVWPLLGAAILVPLREFTNSAFGGGGSGLTYILFGGIIMVLARFEPGGLMEIGRRIAAGSRRGLRLHGARGRVGDRAA